MIVMELIVELQKMPPHLPVYRGDASYGYLSIDEVDTREVTEDDYNPATQQHERRQQNAERLRR